jgi:hypothetical protein
MSEIVSFSEKSSCRVWGATVRAVVRFVRERLGEEFPIVARLTPEAARSFDAIGTYDFTGFERRVYVELDMLLTTMAREHPAPIAGHWREDCWHMFPAELERVRGALRARLAEPDSE